MTGVAPEPEAAPMQQDPFSVCATFDLKAFQCKRAAPRV